MAPITYSSAHLMWLFLVNILLVAVLTPGCTARISKEPSLISPGEDLPTRVALTIAALEQSQNVSTLEPETRPTSQPASPAEPQETPSPAFTEDTNEPPVSPIPTLSQFISTTLTPASSQMPEQTHTLNVPEAAIQVFRPGPSSKVVSPFRVSAFLLPGYRDNVIIELFGEDGRLLVRKILSYRLNPGVRLQSNADIEFEISAVAEAARLVIRTEDQNKRTISLASIDLILLSLGQEENNPPGDLKEKIAIVEPVRNLSIQGGVITVSGFARPTSPDPLLIELFSEDGKSLGPSRLIAVTLEDEAQHTPFEVEIPYSITNPTRARLFITERDYRRMETLHVTSVEIHLRP
jgi:hypothetical protein